MSAGTAEPDLTTTRMAAFIAEIGLGLRWDHLEAPTQLPGIAIDHGTLVVDLDRLKHPGDLLHEAGHLAVVPAVDRSSIDGNAGSDGAREMSAIAWSYAALRHLTLDPVIVFHPDGYRGGSTNIIDTFTAGRGFGVPMLQWLGMTAVAERAEQLGVPPYPHMIKWVLD